MKALKECGAVGFTDDGLPIMDSDIIYNAMLKAKELDMPLSFHEEDPSLITVAGINEGEISKKLGIKVFYETIHSSDVFYHHSDDFKFTDLVEKYNCMAVEMESFALFHNANYFKKQAACLLTVSDSLVTHEATTAEERQLAFDQMIKIALEVTK